MHGTTSMRLEEGANIGGAQTQMPWLIIDGVLQIPWDSLASEVRGKLARHEPMLANRRLLHHGALHATWEEWARLGTLPETDEEEFLADWATLQDALADA